MSKDIETKLLYEALSLISEGQNDKAEKLIGKVYSDIMKQERLIIESEEMSVADMGEDFAEDISIEDTPEEEIVAIADEIVADVKEGDFDEDIKTLADELSVSAESYKASVESADDEKITESVDPITGEEIEDDTESKDDAKNDLLEKVYTLKDKIETVDAESPVLAKLEDIEEKICPEETCPECGEEPCICDKPAIKETEEPAGMNVADPPSEEVPAEAEERKEEEVSDVEAVDQLNDDLEDLKFTVEDDIDAILEKFNKAQAEKVEAPAEEVVVKKEEGKEEVNETYEQRVVLPRSKMTSEEAGVVKKGMALKNSQDISKKVGMNVNSKADTKGESLPEKAKGKFGSDESNTYSEKVAK